jgi:DNA primase
MLDPSEFLAEAQALAVGEKRKLRHLCGDASLVVYNNVDSWTAWCWRCHMSGFVPKPQPTMQERLERQAQQQRIDNAIRSVKQPYPAVYDIAAWPPAARLWLYKAGLNAELIRKLGAYWHVGSARVVLPITDQNGQVVFWQARNAEYPKDGRPKYISSSTPRDTVHAAFRGDGAGTPGEHTPVVVEDILSAFKIGAAGGFGYAVMGTQLGTHTLGLLARSCGGRCLLWFDPDGAGREALGNIGGQLRLLGIQPVPIITDKDPKAYSLREIRETISVRSHATTDYEGAPTVLSTALNAEREVDQPTH